MATKIIAGVLLIISLALAGTVGVAVFTDQPHRTAPAGSTVNDLPSCDMGSTECADKPCCNQPPREELLKSGAAAESEK